MIIKAGVIGVAMLCTSLAFADEGSESATVQLNGGSMALGVDANWGGGPSREGMRPSSAWRGR